MPPKLKTTDETPQDEAGAGPSYVTADDLDAKLNAAITGHLKRFAKDLDKRLGDLVAAIPKPSEGDGEDGAPAGKGGPDPAVARELAALKAQLERERRAREEADKARADMEAKRAREEERSSVANALREAGITNPVQVKAAMALLLEEGRVKRDESGRIGFATPDRYGGEEFHDLAEGVTNWVKGDGKVFAPPKAASGSGNTPSAPRQGIPGARGNAAQGILDPAAAAKAKKDAALRDLSRAMAGLPPESAEGE